MPPHSSPTPHLLVRVGADERGDDRARAGPGDDTGKKASVEQALDHAYVVQAASGASGASQQVRRVVGVGVVEGGV